MPTDSHNERSLKANTVNLTTQRTEIKAKRANVNAGVVKVVKAKEPPRRAHVEDPLTKDERAEIKRLINEWVSTSNLVGRPLQHGGAWGRLYKSGMDDQVNGIEQIERSEFAHCKNWLNQQIRICESSSLSKTRKKPGHAERLIRTIQTLCGKLDISEDRRKQYMLDRWGKDSLTEFSFSELEAFAQYVRGDNPSFQYKEKADPREHGRRERALVSWLEEIQANDPAIDIQRLPFTKMEIHAILRDREPTLFGITDSYFDDFWKQKKKGMCGLKVGRRPSGSHN